MIVREALMPDPRVVQALSVELQQRFIADRLGQADVVIRFGTISRAPRACH